MNYFKKVFERFCKILSLRWRASSEVTQSASTSTSFLIASKRTVRENSAASSVKHLRSVKHLGRFKM